MSKGSCETYQTKKTSPSSCGAVDVAIVGAGALGCLLARELSRYHCDVVVLEAASDVGEGASKANSGIIHTGFHPRGGSLKGRSCVEGNALYTQLVDELGIPFERTGALMVAFGEEGLQKLHDKQARARKNGASELRIVDGDEARELEPLLSPSVVAALLAPSTGIISPFAVVLAAARNALRNGVDFRFSARVEHIEREGEGYRLHVSDGSMLVARYVVNMAGGDAARVDAFVHPAELVILPRVGEYLVFDKQAFGAKKIDHVLFQAAENDEGGVLITPTIDGNLLAGPTSRNVRSFADVSTTEQGLDHIRTVARKLIPSLDWSGVITNFAGARANVSNVEKELKDFVLRASAPHFISALGIKNPGLTAAPALALRTVRLLRDEGLELESDSSFDPIEKPRIPFLACGSSEQKRLMQEDSSFGHVVCRCESITEGDVRRVLHDPIPPRTFTGLKHRLRVGMGRCQGTFCAPRIIEIVAREWGVAPEEVKMGERGGHLVMRSNK